MKQIILTLGIFSLGFLVSCENDADKVEETEHHEHHEHEEGHDHDHEEHEDEEAHAHDDGEPLSLNDGEKWKVNEEMKPHVEKGHKLVVVYIDSGSKEYKELAEELKAENQKLISSCTMEGTSHDELHKWLHPHLEMTEKLGFANNAEEAKGAVNDLLKSYELYHKYFQ